MPNKSDIIQIQTVIGRLKLKDFKEDLVLTYTNERTTHVSEMTPKEAQALIAHLRALQQPNAVQDTANLMRRKIISKWREMGLNVYSPAKQYMVADMIKIEEKMVNHWGKLLNEYTESELSKIIGVLEEKFLPWYYKNKNTDVNLNG